MGISFSWPEGFQTLIANACNGFGCLFGNGPDAVLVRSPRFKEKALLRTLSGSLSFKSRSLESNVSGSRSFKSTALQRNGSGSIRFRTRKLERNASGSNSFKGSFQGVGPPGSFERMDSTRSNLGSDIFKGNEITESGRSVNSEVSLNSGSFKEEAAAVKLQKVYKSYRTRRNLADCAVLVEELWWQAIDFVTLKRSTVSFFDISRHESASSRWARARIKAAKVGKGLSKDDKARKLAFQHWLEAIDPRHRYGHNLHFYYDAWFESATAEPFYYWLDVGEGRDLSLDSCPRSKLQQQCIKYLGPKEREQYEVIVKDGRLTYKHSNEPVDTSVGSKWIFVLSTSKKLYVGKKRKGTFQHSSFLAGGATSAAGRLVAEGGILKSIWPYSGHYLPTEENFKEFIGFLEENSVNLTNVQKTPADEDEQSTHIGNAAIGSEPVSEAEKEEPSINENFNAMTFTTERNASFKDSESSAALPFSGGQAESVRTGNRIRHYRSEDLSEKVSANSLGTPVPTAQRLILQNNDGSAKDGSWAEEQVNGEALRYKRSLSDKNLHAPQQSLLKRLESKKSLKSYQLGKQVSFKWCTGAGPRIVCVRDYPSELRVKALEKVNLSPRCGASSNSSKAFVDMSSPLVSSKCTS